MNKETMSLRDLRLKERMEHEYRPFESWIDVQNFFEYLDVKILKAIMGLINCKFNFLYTDSSNSYYLGQLCLLKEMYRIYGGRFAWIWAESNKVIVRFNRPASTHISRYICYYNDYEKTSDVDLFYSYREH